MDSITCSECGESLTEESQECPKCGSSRKSVGISANLSVGVSSRLSEVRQYDFRRNAKHKLRAILTDKDEIFKKTGQPVRRVMDVDKIQDRYFERVTVLETGEVIHICDMKLTDHQGHGSAKYKK